MNPLVQIGGASETQAPLWSKPVLAGICMESSRHNGAYISMIFGKMSFFLSCTFWVWQPFPQPAQVRVGTKFWRNMLLVNETSGNVAKQCSLDHNTDPLHDFNNANRSYCFSLILNLCDKQKCFLYLGLVVLPENWLARILSQLSCHFFVFLTHNSTENPRCHVRVHALVCNFLCIIFLRVV